jgi:hypothetical protein
MLPIMGRNSVDLKGYSVCANFDSSVFSVNPAVVDTAGTCAAAAFMTQPGSSDTTAQVAVVYSVSCPPEVAAGEHPPGQPFIYLLMDVKPTATLGPTTIEIKDIGSSKNRMTTCGGSTLTPVLASASVEITCEASILDEGESGDTKRAIFLRAIPNPSTGLTSIYYSIPAEEKIRMVIYNTAGQEIRRLADESAPAGMHKVIWDGRNSTGNAVPNGIYFCRLEAGAPKVMEKIVIVK